MLNLSRIQLELERAKEKLRSVEETIQKVEGKTYSNGPARYSSLKVELHSDKLRNPAAIEDAKNQRRRVIASAVDSRVQRLSTDDAGFGLKRGIRDKREPGLGLKRQVSDNRPQGVFARLSGPPYQQADDEEVDDFGKKPTLPSRVYTTTTAEAPSRQEVIAAQAVDEQSKQRNRRMFGALVGTLQKFRKEETRVREREEKRLKVEKKLEEDAKREKEKLMQEKRELFLEKKRREVEIKRIEWSLNRVKEYEAWEANVIPLKNFIQTQAKPHIFYLPCAHNTKTEERLAHSQKLVERMIEKRKTNLKEEIENSEKKARKAAAEEAEGEEAENIPEENDEAHNAEKMQVDYKPEKNENGYLEEGKKIQEGSSKLVDDTMDTGKEETWDEPEEPEAEKSGESLENENKLCSSNKDESKEELLMTESSDFNKELTSINEERPSDAEGPLGGNVGDSSEARGSKVPSEESEHERVVGETVEEEGNIPDSVMSKSNDNALEKKSEPQDNDESVSEPKTEGSSNQKADSQEDKNKAEEKSRPRESRGRKAGRRSRSPRRSKSSRNSSDSLSRSRSPPSKRRQRNLPSRKRSPPAKTRRRSSSRTLLSPRKRRSRSSSSGSSKSD